MSFPIYPEKYKLKELYGAREIVGYRKQIGRMPSLSAPEGVLFFCNFSIAANISWISAFVQISFRSISFIFY